MVVVVVVTNRSPIYPSAKPFLGSICLASLTGQNKDERLPGTSTRRDGEGTAITHPESNSLPSPINYPLIRLASSGCQASHQLRERSFLVIRPRITRLYRESADGLRGCHIRLLGVGGTTWQLP